MEPGSLKDSLKNLVKHILQVFEQTQYCSTSLSQVQFLPKISVYMIHNLGNTKYDIEQNIHQDSSYFTALLLNGCLNSHCQPFSGMPRKFLPNTMIIPHAYIMQLMHIWGIWFSMRGQYIPQTVIRGLLAFSSSSMQDNLWRSWNECRQVCGRLVKAKIGNDWS